MKFKGSIEITKPRNRVVELFADPTSLKEYQDGFINKELVRGKEGEDGAVSKEQKDKEEIRQSPPMQAIYLKLMGMSE